jgi:hypothetical protein
MMNRMTLFGMTKTMNQGIVASIQVIVTSSEPALSEYHPARGDAKTVGTIAAIETKPTLVES